MSRLELSEAQDRLTEILEQMHPGESLLLQRHGMPVATLIRTPEKLWPCKAGSAKHREHWMAPDFDAPLEEFSEYME